MIGLATSDVQKRMDQINWKPFRAAVHNALGHKVFSNTRVLRPIFQDLHKALEESVGLEAIEGAVVDGEGDVEHWKHLDEVFPALLAHAHPLLHLADTENS